MKKSGLAFIALIAVGAIYYFTVGSTQIVTEIKKEINREVVELEKSGFIVKDREVKERSEHFVIDFNDTKNITKYLKDTTHNVSESDVELLRGLKVSVDIEYTPTVKDAIAFDIYPIKLPTFFYEEIKDDNISIEAIDKMLKGKLVLVHVNVNKLLSGFNGYLKDIDTKFDNGDKNGHFVTKGFSFNGDIQDENIKNLRQNIEKMSFEAGEEIKIGVSNLKLFIKNPTDEKYGDNNSNYSIESLDIKSKDDENLSLVVNGISGSSKDTKKGELADGATQVNIASIDYNTNSENMSLKNSSADIKIENVDIEAMKQLETILEDDNASFQQMLPMLKKITKSDLSFSISNLSLESITNNGQKMDGFNITALAKVNKDFDWKGVETDPMRLIQLGDIQAEIALSNGLFSVVAQDPKMMMVMMMAQPVDKNGTKVYNLEFSQGSLKVNGKPFM